MSFSNTDDSTMFVPTRPSCTPMGLKLSIYLRGKAEEIISSKLYLGKQPQTKYHFSTRNLGGLRSTRATLFIRKQAIIDLRDVWSALVDRRADWNTDKKENSFPRHRKIWWYCDLSCSDYAVLMISLQRTDSKMRVFPATESKACLPLKL